MWLRVGLIGLMAWARQLPSLVSQMAPVSEVGPEIGPDVGPVSEVAQVPSPPRSDGRPDRGGSTAVHGAPGPQGIGVWRGENCGAADRAKGGCDRVEPKS